MVAVDEETGYCEATGAAVNSPHGGHDWLCQLPAGHFGAHSWQMSSTAMGRAPMLVFLSADGIERADPLCRAVCSGAGVVVFCVSYRTPPWPDG